MNISALGTAVLGLVILTSVGGCAPNEQIRTNLVSTGPNDPKAVFETTKEYTLGFVEFDDQGWFWCEKQREAVEKMVRQAAGVDGGAKAPSRPIVLVTFVHGWKDNSEFHNDGVVAMRRILCQLNQAEQANHTPRRVVGVYCGWRGMTIRWDPAMELTFWDRKDAAHKVGGYGAMTKLLVDLENIQKDNLERLPEDAPRTELIIIGHSLGAGAVYSALSQIITERLAEAEKYNRRLKPLGDQIILLNPAFEAQRHYDLNLMATAYHGYTKEQRPVVSVFTSKGDWATQTVFPIGQFFATLFDSNRNGDQRKAGLQTAGWYKTFRTHDLVYDVTSKFDEARIPTFNPQTQSNEFHDPKKMQQSVVATNAQKDKWRRRDVLEQNFYFDDAVLKPADTYSPGDPFLIVTVDKGIMSDHTDISDKVLINFIRQYIQFCQVEPTDRQSR